MKSFNFEFEENKPNRITFDYSPEADEEFDTAIEDGIPILYANRPGLISLAKTLIKMAMGEYSDGFHVHLRKDLNADEPDRLIVMLHSSGQSHRSGPASCEQGVISEPPK
jgi:hypothetical protein